MAADPNKKYIISQGTKILTFSKITLPQIVVNQEPVTTNQSVSSTQTSIENGQKTQINAQR